MNEEKVKNKIDCWKKGDYVLAYSFNYDRAGKTNDEILKYIEKQDKEIERLNNIINEYDKWLNREIRYRDEKLYNQGYHDAIVDSKDKLKELKENK